MGRASIPASTAAGIALLACTAAPAAAQVLRIPQRAAETTAPPVDLLQTRGQFTVDLLGGYDDTAARDATTGGGGVGAPPLVDEPGYVGLADIAFVYGRTHGARQLSFDARAGVTGYKGLGIGPSQRASGGITAATNMGRSTTVHVDNHISYDALYAAASFAPVASEVPIGELPTSSTLTSVAQRKSWANATSIGLDQEFGRRDTVGLEYDFDYRDFLEESDPSSHTHAVRTSYEHQISRNGSLSASYAYSQGEFVGGFRVLDQRPLATHSVEAGPSFTKRLSPRRSVVVGFGAGATRVSTVTGEAAEVSEFWTPFGHFTARVDLGQTWALTGNYRREASVLDGLTPETYISDTFGGSVGGNVNDHVQLTFAGGAATGQMGATTTVTSAYTSYVASAQVSFYLTRTISTLVNYSYFQYDFSGDPVVTEGVPQNMSRNAIRVGLSYALPITRQPRAARP